MAPASLILAQVELHHFEGRDNERLEVIEEAKKLISRLQYKEELIYDITFSQPIVFAALQVCLDVGLWAGWSAAGGKSTSVEDLCNVCKYNIEPNLLRRLLRLLASVYIIKEIEEDTFQLTPFSICLGERSSFIPQTLQCSTYHWRMTCLNLPKYLKKMGYKEPQDAQNTNYIDWCPENLDFFGKNAADPAYHDAFSGFMRGWSLYKLPWPEFYDTQSLLDGADLSSAPFCVDVGGHHGVDITRLLDRHPELPTGSLVLQDLPEVVAGVSGLSDKISVMGYNALDPQPVKGTEVMHFAKCTREDQLANYDEGARAYYFHAVFHDWPDSTAIKMLKNTVAAMKRGYSRLLVNDIALPATGASWIQTTMDVEMMAIFSSYERSDAMWADLLTKAGLRIIKFWRDKRRNESVIETELI